MPKPKLPRLARKVHSPKKKPMPAIPSRLNRRERETAWFSILLGLGARDSECYPFKQNRRIVLHRGTEALQQYLSLPQTGRVDRKTFRVALKCIERGETPLFHWYYDIIGP